MRGCCGEYRPQQGPLERAVASLPADLVDALVPVDLTESLERFAEAVGAVPDDMKPPPDEDGLAEAYVAPGQA